MRTTDAKRLMTDVLASLPQPHTCDVMDDVYYEIEQRVDWKRRYGELCDELGKAAAGNWCGFWIANLEDRRRGEQVPTTRSRLIATYWKLAEKTEAPRKKVKEADAVESMAAYFQENRSKLPQAIRKHRETIVELLMAGISAEDAFSTVVANGA
ncbi:MAG: hypothetical protein WCB48_01295 [Casimicrobiaceae bacterium]